MLPEAAKERVVNLRPIANKKDDYIHVGLEERGSLRTERDGTGRAFPKCSKAERARSTTNAKSQLQGFSAPGRREDPGLGIGVSRHLILPRQSGNRRVSSLINDTTMISAV